MSAPPTRCSDRCGINSNGCPGWMNWPKTTRPIWGFLEKLDLSAFYGDQGDAGPARALHNGSGVAGRVVVGHGGGDQCPAAGPPVPRARYRWLCGGVPDFLLEQCLLASFPRQYPVQSKPTGTSRPEIMPRNASSRPDKVSAPRVPGKAVQRRSLGKPGTSLIGHSDGTSLIAITRLAKNGASWLS